MLNRDCPKCEGTGRYRDSRIWGTMPGAATCDDCDGIGKVRPAKPSVPPPVPAGIREAWGVGGAGPGRAVRPADLLGPISRYEVQEVAEGAWRCWATDDRCRTITQGNGGTAAAALAACQAADGDRLRELLSWALGWIDHAPTGPPADDDQRDGEQDRTMYDRAHEAIQ